MNRQDLRKHFQRNPKAFNLYKMIKHLIILIITLGLVVSCKDLFVKDLIDKIDPPIDYSTDSEIPIDTTEYDSARNSRVISKAKTYIIQSYDHSTSSHYDEYGLLLPEENGIFEDQGDAIGWNAVSLQAMCFIQQGYNNGILTDPTFDVSSDINQLWSDMKSSVILDSGTIIRHPTDPDTTSISKDHMQLFMTTLAVAQYTNCSPIKDDAGSIISKFIDYGKVNNWDYAISDDKSALSTTVLNGRHGLYELQNLYNLNYSESSLDLSTSLESTRFNSLIADYINENRYYCRLGFAGSCLRIGDSYTYGNHLLYQSIITYSIGSRTLSNPVYTTSEVNDFLSNIGKIGDSIDQNNWLYVTGYRYFVLDNPTYNDVLKHLDEDWPDSLPTEIAGVNKWGCTDFVWQWVGHERCGNINREYIGTDFLLPFSMIFSK